MFVENPPPPPSSPHFPLHRGDRQTERHTDKDKTHLGDRKTDRQRETHTDTDKTRFSKDI